MADSSSQPDPAVRTRTPKLDTTVSHPARIWNYWLGGKDNYAVDRDIGDRHVEIFPGTIEIARAERAFLVRAVRYLAEEVGIRQFLDIGTGLPTLNNTHEVAQSVAPESRIVYVDNDPLVLLHARAMLVGTAEGATDYIDADLRNPASILEEAGRKLDFDEPIALMLLGVLGFLTDADDMYAIVKRLLDALPSGSYMAMCDGTSDGSDEVDSKAYEEANRLWSEVGSIPYNIRSSEEISRFFDGLDLVEPGLVSVPLWRPDPVDVSAPRELDLFGGVGRKP